MDLFNAYVNLVEERLARVAKPGEDSLRYVLFSSYIFDFVMGAKYDFSMMARWSVRRPTKDADAMFFPCFLPGRRWILVGVSLQTAYVDMYDPRGGTDDDVASSFCQWAVDEENACGSVPTVWRVRHINCLGPVESSCGVAVLKRIDMMTRAFRPGSTNIHQPCFIRRVAAELLMSRV